MTTKRLRARRMSIIHQLAHLSRGGWINAGPDDYRPLESKLRDIEAELRRRRVRHRFG